MERQQRMLVKILKELASELGFVYKSFSNDWIILLEKENKKLFICGYDFENNTSAIKQITNDKNACFCVLEDAGIPSVPHHIFHGPKIESSIPEEGNWGALVSKAQEYNWQCVLKANAGTGGNDVYRIFNKKELELAAHSLFANNRSLSLCPYYDIVDEYRVFVLDGEPQLIYKKQRPSVIGDGKSSILELTVKSGLTFSEWDKTIDFSLIPNEGEEVVLLWKHNLGKGAQAVLVEDPAVTQKLMQIARKTSSELSLGFASVDIISVVDGSYMVLEVNGGVMMEVFAKQGDKEYQLSKELYKKALLSYFDKK